MTMYWIWVGICIGIGLMLASILVNLAKKTAKWIIHHWQGIAIATWLLFVVLTLAILTTAEEISDTAVGVLSMIVFGHVAVGAAYTSWRQKRLHPSLVWCAVVAIIFCAVGYLSSHPEVQSSLHSYYLAHIKWISLHLPLANANLVFMYIILFYLFAGAVVCAALWKLVLDALVGILWLYKVFRDWIYHLRGEHDVPTFLNKVKRVCGEKISNPGKERKK
jgi:hypothetical protein